MTDYRARHDRAELHLLGAAENAVLEGRSANQVQQDVLVDLLLHEARTGDREGAKLVSRALGIGRDEDASLHEASGDLTALRTGGAA